MSSWFNFSTFPQGLEFPCGCSLVIISVVGGFEVLITSPGNVLPVRPVIAFPSGKPRIFHTYKEAYSWVEKTYRDILLSVGDLPPSIRPNRMN